MNNIYGVILGAGEGTRMKSCLPKILHKVANRSLFEHVLSSVNEIKADKNVIVITSNDILNDFKDKMPKEDKQLHYVIQHEKYTIKFHINNNQKKYL